MDLQFLLDRYKWELDQRDKISSAVNFPVTIIILVSGLLGALLPKLQVVSPSVVLLVVGLFLTAGISGVARPLLRGRREREEEKISAGRPGRWQGQTDESGSRTQGRGDRRQSRGQHASASHAR